MNNINCNITERLKEALMKQGFRSTVSAFGVQATPLAKHLGVSVQTIRKYLTGEATPDLNKIIIIAEFLKVSPGWLAFGLNEIFTDSYKSIFEIKKIFIKEIFQGLLQNILDIKLDDDLLESVYDFLYGIINDIAQLESNDKIKLRLIKTSIASASIMEKIKWKKTSLIT